MRETGGGKGARRGRKERAGRGKVPSYVDPLAGGISGLAVRALTAPFDLVKIRLQLTPASCSATTVNTVKSVYKKEGPWAFFKGNVAATYLWVTYAAVQFTLYNKISNYLAGAEPGEGETGSPHLRFASVHRRAYPPSHAPDSLAAENYFPYVSLNPSMIAFIAGASAGVTATLATYPLDYTRTAFASNKNRQSQSLAFFVKETFVKKGPMGFYAGVAPAVASIVPLMGLNFMGKERAMTIRATHAKRCPGFCRWLRGRAVVFLCRPCRFAPCHSMPPRTACMKTTANLSPHNDNEKTLQI